jgi:hypothetical protein
MWQRGDIGDTGLSWDQAKSYCDGLKLDGYTDWRLPEIEALQTIVDYSRFGPALSTNVLHGRSGVYWSGSTDVDDPDAAWNVHFLNGRVSDLDDKADSYYCVRCVRGGAGNAQATVSFTPPAHGGSPNSSYTVTSSHGAKTTTGASSPITVTGLANGSAYTFTVEATNAIGAGAASSPSNSVMPDGYVNNGDGTVTANQTGLMWQKADDGVYRNWADAGQYCENLDLGGHDDWRLPNIDELKTLVDRSRSPTIDPVFSCKLDYYWSRSTDVYDPDNECLVYFRDGEVDAYTETYYGGYVRCVRRTLII